MAVRKMQKDLGIRNGAMAMRGEGFLQGLGGMSACVGSLQRRALVEEHRIF